jgi:hypothetical protein
MALATPSVPPLPQGERERTAVAETSNQYLKTKFDHHQRLLVAVPLAQQVFCQIAEDRPWQRGERQRAGDVDRG